MSPDLLHAWMCASFLKPTDRLLWHAAPDSVANAEEKDRIRLVFHSDQGATDIISLLSLKTGRYDFTCDALPCRVRVLFISHACMRGASHCTTRLFGILEDSYRFMKHLRCREGGISKWVSSIAIHNELMRRGRMVSRSKPFIRSAELHCTACIRHRLSLD